MKKNVLFSFLVAILFIGCSDLEENPEGQLSPDGFVQNVDDLQAVVNGSYSYLASEEFWGRKYVLAIMLRSDMVDIGDPATQPPRIQVNNFEMATDNSMVGTFWPRIYAVIGNANTAIAAAETLEGEDQNEVNGVVAQARFLRAFGYYHLVRTFGAVPYLDFAVTEPSQVDGILRTPEEDVYKGIIADLEFAKEWLPDNPAVRSLPGKGTAAAYLASVYLTTEQWQKSYDEAKFVIDNAGTFNYALEPDFQNLFDGDNSVQPNLKETVFSVDFKGGDQNNADPGNLSRDYMAPITGIRGYESAAREGWSVAVPSLAVYDSFDDNDYRKEVSFITEMTDINGNFVTFESFGNYNKGVSRPSIAKYFLKPGATFSNNARDSDINYAAMRYAEVLLIAAEALNEVSGPSAEAYGYINAVRARARNTPDGVANFPEDLDGLSTEQFRDAVLEERRIELAFEYKRWFDQKRRNLWDGFKPGGLEPRPSFVLPKNALFPLPQNELSISTSLTQNPGY